MFSSQTTLIWSTWKTDTESGYSSAIRGSLDSSNSTIKKHTRILRKHVLAKNDTLLHEMADSFVKVSISDVKWLEK